MDLNNRNGPALTHSKIDFSQNLTPEKVEELKLKNKYPSTNKSGGSQFILKMLTKGVSVLLNFEFFLYRLRKNMFFHLKNKKQHKKYFDSGDYNMAKSKIKTTLAPAGIDSISHNTSIAPLTPSSTYESSRSRNPSVLSPHVNFPSMHFHPCNCCLENLLTENLIDENTIGYEIPTVECLMARKHLIVQSKLATYQP
jgi:hypothetical protein